MAAAIEILSCGMANGKMGDPERVNEPDYFLILFRYCVGDACEIWMIPDRTRATRKVIELKSQIDEEEYMHLAATYFTGHKLLPEDSEIKTEVIKGSLARIFGSMLIQIGEDNEERAEAELHVVR